MDDSPRPKITPATLHSEGHNGFDQDPMDNSEDDERDNDSSNGDEVYSFLLGSDETVYKPALSARFYKCWTQVSGIVIESTPTLLLTTLAFILSGELLDRISRWRAMRQIDELVIIIPVILNLKGNIEMNLSARMSTAAHIGELDKPQTRRKLILGSLCLLQVQAAVASFIAACVAFVIGHFLPPAANSMNTSFASMAMLSNTTVAQNTTGVIIHQPLSDLAVFGMVVATAMTSTCLSSLILGLFMCALIVTCTWYGRNPDNIAPPTASCLGDIIALSFFALISSFLIDFIETPFPLILTLMTILSAGVCLFWTCKNPFVRNFVTQGWVPLLGALVLSNGTGIVLDSFITRYDGFALLSIVISGLPGSVGSIYVSRLSTALHSAALALTSLPSSNHPSECKQELNPRAVMVALLTVTLFVAIFSLCLIQAFGWLHLSLTFIGVSILFFTVTGMISLVLARALTQLLWSRNFDPDTHALPIHAALMDLIGTLLLVGCYELATLLGAGKLTSKSS